MHKMTNLEYSFITSELSALVVGKHFSRIRKVGDGIYRMKIGTFEILCELGVRLHTTKYMEDPQPHDKFVQKLEKELDNAKLLEIKQINSDRIISFDFDRASLVFEMFGKGNIILVKEGTTVAAFKYETWSDREIKVGSPYKSPSNVPMEKLVPSDKYIIVSLMKLPLGKEYVQEALLRSSIEEKTPGSKLTPEQLAELEKQLEIIKSSTSPHLYKSGEKPIAFSLTSITPLSEFTCEETNSLSEAADEYYKNVDAPNVDLEKLQKRLEKQNERVELLKQEEIAYKEKGDYIYAHYMEVQQVLEEAKAGKGELNKKEKSVEAEI
ncbi:NFACT family protein [Candidatus Micrarchaeota archaeon]|nr:NFACT family protein [Candidatus Micrarchaeota archaeon]